MTLEQRKVALWIVFTAIFYIVWLGVTYLMSGEIDIWEAVFFFVVLGVLDKQGIDYYVKRQLEREGISPDEDGENA